MIFPPLSVADAFRAVATPGWALAGSLNNARGFFLRGHGAALTSVPGSVVVIGGYDTNTGTLATVERYSLARKVWTYDPPMATTRYGHTVTLLQDGRMMAIGGDVGVEGTELTTTCELRNPDTGVWTFSAPMHEARLYHSATLLDDGRVLVAGGYILVSEGVIAPSATSEVYDPVEDEWTVVGSMSTIRYQHGAAKLLDGKVLVAGGLTPTSLASSELFDPETGLWTVTTGPMSATRYGHSMLALADGRVLCAGGTNGATARNTAELYTPGTGLWTATAGTMSTARMMTASIAFPDGRALICGGFNEVDYLASSEIFDPVTTTFSSGGDMSTTRAHAAIALLNARTAIVIGGSDDSEIEINSVETFTLS